MAVRCHRRRWSSGCVAPTCFRPRAVHPHTLVVVSGEGHPAQTGLGDKYCRQRDNASRYSRTQGSQCVRKPCLPSFLPLGDLILEASARRPRHHSTAGWGRGREEGFPRGPTKVLRFF